MINLIKLNNFRLFHEANFKTNNSLVIFSGKNATGKTSILEAIYLCSTSKSHRTNDINTLISKNQEYASCEIEGEKKYRIILNKDGKSYFINKQQIKSVGNFIGSLSVVLFSPQDLFLINGTKSERRRFLDLEISLINKIYLKEVYKYKKILQERNNLLKEKEIDRVLLDILTQQLIDALIPIYQQRIKFIEEINNYLLEISKEMNIEKISIKYDKTYEDDIKKSFNNKLNLDIVTKVTNIGIHRDDIKIYINDLLAINYASEGQSRIICIAIKLAIMKYITDKTGKEPILLLDDVFAALDKERIENITNYINKCKQTFITTTSVLEIPNDLLKNALVIRIEKEREE